MRIRALTRILLLALPLMFLLTVARAGSMPLGSLLVSTSIPVWSNFQPSGWVTGTQVTCSVLVDNQDGVIPVGAYRYSTNGGATWSGELNQGLTVVVGGSSTSASLTVANLPLPESATPDQNLIAFSIRDNLGVQRWSDSYSVRIDNTVPGSTVTSAGCYGLDWPGTITGTASDLGSGPSLVEIALRRDSDGRYYNGSSWQASRVWLAAAGTTGWSYSVTLGDGSYSVQSRATDGVGHRQTAYGEGTFSHDGAAPQSVVETAGCFTLDTWTDVIVGSASDEFSGVANVQITLRRSVDGLYYNGSTWESSATWLSVSGTTAWSLPFTPTVESTYAVMSRATDNCGNVQSTFGESAFAYDNSSPQSAPTSSGCFGAGDWPGAIRGTASDAGSGIKSVQITVRRTSDGLYYDGSSWGASARWLSVSGTTSWSLPFTPPLETLYTVRSRATNNCDHVQTVFGEASFTYDHTMPASTIVTSGCYNAGAWAGAITGTASDSSGVASVQITLRRASDGLYYNGSSWGSSVAWLPASGTTNWSLAFTPVVEGTYTVRSRASDSCGNVQGSLSTSSFSYDVTIPQSSVTTSGYFNAGSWPGAVSGTASDAMSGVKSVRITLRRASDGRYYNGSSWVSTPAWLPVSGTTAWTLSFMPVVETTYLVNSEATDECGNAQSEHGTGTFAYSTAAPGAPFNLSVTPSGWTQTNSFTLNWSNPPHPSGIVRAYYKWDDPPTNNGDQSPGSPVDGAGIRSISGLSVPAEGTHRIYLWLEDAAGNVNYMNRGVSAADAFKWDITPPNTSVESISGGQGCSGWYTSTVQVKLSAVDAASAISSTLWRQDGGSWQQASGSSFTIVGEGTHTVEYYSVDLAGNSEAPQVLSPPVKIDAIPPATNPPSFTGTLGRNGWYTSSVGVSLSALDATSGVSTTYHQVNGGAFEEGRTFDVTTDGVHAVRYYSLDVACNQESVQTAATPIKIDRTPPTTSAQTDGVSKNGWFTASPVTVTLLASDAVDGVQTSGIDNIRYRTDSGSWQQHGGEVLVLIVSTPPGVREWRQTIEYYATDMAGNEESPRTLEIVIDAQAPGAINVYPIVTPPGWTKNNCFTLTWEASANPPDFSGIGGAYYSFVEPFSPTDGTLVLGENITAIPCIQVPVELGDGPHNVYVWLQDGAGNSDHRTRRVVTVRLDRSPPEVMPVVTGNQCATSDWYNSCVTVTFVATDVHSGMASGVISYQVNSESWVEGNSYTICDEGVYRIDCRATDSAGNTSDIVAAPLLRVDPLAPGAPMDVQVVPADWSKVNTFTISWLNPGDLSGLAGVFYKQGSLPVSPTDGVYVDGVRSSVSVVASTEGEIPVYVWLKDKACNSDHESRATAMLKYDRTAPTTTVTKSGTQGSEGWYISEVEIALEVEDLASGWGSSHYRVGEGSWASGTEFMIGASGVTTFSYYSVDAAGNVEDVQAGSVRIDRDPPSSSAYVDRSYSSTSAFTVYWNGSDALSEIASFDVQYRIGPREAWQDWQQGVDRSQVSKLFTGAVAGKCYYFRSRATDGAGNVEPYPSTADAYVCVDVLQNGNFERTVGSEWQATWIPGDEGQTSACYPMRVTTQSYAGGTTQAMVLGCPNQAGGAPIGVSMICQSFSVPAAPDWPAPMLQFRYHVFTYDVVWGQTTRRFYDSFNVGLVPPAGIEPTYVFTDGNMTQNFDVLMDLGWRQGGVDLRPYAGQAVKVCLANVTRWDTQYNTWTFVDDVRLVNLEHRVYVPAVQRKSPVAAVSADVRPADARLGPKGRR